MFMHITKVSKNIHYYSKTRCKQISEPQKEYCKEESEMS